MIIFINKKSTAMGGFFEVLLEAHLL